jgi:Uma2 family endonuclease
MVTAQDLEIHSPADFDGLPDDGLWEVADGRAILLPGNEWDHQELSTGLIYRILEALKRLGHGQRMHTVNVDIPALPGEGFRTRVPDLVVCEHRPEQKRFPVGAPPEIAVEILSTRRGNVERTEKMEDYARAGISEYWIVDPFEKDVEVYLLRDGAYQLAQVARNEIASIAMPGLHVDLRGLFDLS